MNKKLKTVIMIIIMISMCVLMFLTMNYAKNNLKSINDNSPMNNTLEKPDGNAPGTNEGSSLEKPDGNAPGTSEGSTLEKPDGNAPGTNEGSTLEKPDDNRPNMENPSGMIGLNDVKITYIYYIIFGIESLIFVSVLVYFIMSNLNKKSLKETFVNSDKVIIYVLLVIVLSTSITLLDGVVTNKLLSNNMDNINENKNNNSNKSSSISYKGVEEITQDKKIDSGNFISTTSDENALLISSDIDVDIENISVSKTGNSDGGDNTSFYGINSGIIAKDGAELTLKNITVTTNATGANGIFSYGGSATTNNSKSDGTTITISDSKITTTSDNSGGIMTTGGGIMNANNLEVTTSGTSSAAIRSDRGGGTVTVNKGTYKTTGVGSPSIYSTADITVNDAELISTKSEGIVIEGANSVVLNNSTLTDTNNILNGKSTTYKNIFLYQSMSGDAMYGTSSFTSTNSKIITNKGDTFYVTNTSATIILENNEIINNDSTGNFLRIQKDSWGNSGANGGNVTLSLKNQKVVGSIVVDSISTLDMKLASSYYEGAINNSNTAKKISLTISKDSKIKLTGDTYVSSLTNEDETNSNIDFNGYKLYVNNVAIN